MVSDILLASQPSKSGKQAGEEKGFTVAVVKNDRFTMPARRANGAKQAGRKSKKGRQRVRDEGRR